MTVDGNLTNTIPEGAVVAANGTLTNVDPVAASLTNLPDASVSKFLPPNPIAAGSFLIPVTGFAPNVFTKLDGATRPALDVSGLRMEISVIKFNTPSWEWN